MSSDIVQLAAFSAAIFGAFFGTIGVCDFIAHKLRGSPKPTPRPLPATRPASHKQPAPVRKSVTPPTPFPQPISGYRSLRDFPEPDPLRFVKKWATQQEEKKKEPPRLVVIKKEVLPDPLDPLEALTKLRDSCLSLFHKKPLKTIPPIFIEPDEHFKNSKLPYVYAHYHTSKDVICFNEKYIKENPTPQSLLDTMKHELLHAWIHQHNFNGDRAHDDLFKATAELLGINWWEGLREF